MKLRFVLLRLSRLYLGLNLRIKLYLLIGGVQKPFFYFISLFGFQSTILFQTCGGSSILLLLLFILVLFETIVEILI